MVEKQDEDRDHDLVVQAAAALYYQANPFDEICDFYSGIGFTDDINIIQRVYSRIVEAN